MTVPIYCHLRHYFVEGQLVTAEEFGNYNYGYVGRGIGNGTQKLKRIAGAVQVISGTSKLGFRDSNFDDPKDQKTIQRGADAYASRLDGRSKFQRASANLSDAQRALSSGDWRGATNALKRALNSLNNRR